VAGLNITIATSPDPTLSIQKDIDLIKTGLLYGDKIKLLSLTPPLMLFMYSSGGFDQKTKDELINGILAGLNEEDARTLALIKQLGQKKRRTREEILLYGQMNRAFKIAREETIKTMTKIAQGTGVQELIPALERDLLDIGSVESMGFSTVDYTENYVEKFIQQIIEETFSGNSFPMYDKEISSLLTTLANEQDVGFSEIRQEQIRHIASVHSALSDLPDFSNASISEILGIRDELGDYLEKFRAAMLEYSKKIKSMPWDKSFDNEVSVLFMSDVAPRIVEIRSIVEQNSFIRKFCTNILNDKSVTITGALGIGAAIAPLPQAIQIPVIALAGTTTIGRSLMNAYNERLDTNNRASENAFYFYYRVGQKLKR